MNNSTINGTSAKCLFLQQHSDLFTLTTYLTYYILMPIRVLVMIPSHSLALTAFKKQATLESSYRYQIFASGVKIVDICEFGVYCVIKFYLAGMNGVGSGVDWFMRQYPLMVIASRVFITTRCVCVLMPVTTASVVSVERAFALYRPFVYRNLDKRRHYVIAVVSVVALSVIFSLDYTVRYTLSWDTAHGYYMAVANPYYAQALWTPIFSYGRVAARFVNMGILVVSSVMSVTLYRKRLKQVNHLTGGRSEDQRKEARRKTNEKTLLVLTLAQAPFMIFNSNILAIYSLGAYFQPTFSSCEGTIVLAVSDMSIQLADMIEYYLIFGVSAEFRRMVRGVVPCCKAAASETGTAIVKMK